MATSTAPGSRWLLGMRGVLAAWAVLMASNCHTKPSQQENISQDEVKTESLRTPASPRSPDQKQGSSEERYERILQAGRQALTIRVDTDRKVRFQLAKEGPCARSLSGEAVMREGDPEIDEDETGLAYPANEYFYVVDNCQLGIRISFDRERARVVEMGCQTSPCAFSEDMMRRSRTNRAE